MPGGFIKGWSKPLPGRLKKRNGVKNKRRTGYKVFGKFVNLKLDGGARKKYRSVMVSVRNNVKRTSRGPKSLKKTSKNSLSLQVGKKNERNETSFSPFQRSTSRPFIRSRRGKIGKNTETIVRTNYVVNVKMKSWKIR